ncbi:MAG: hypothetical protein H0U71_05155 [Gammaproteobacteria bacterium]|nr:hypothetical protein [Gammaproteobacteria bacterium]
MKIIKCLLLFTIVSMSYKVCAINSTIKKKYPYTLLTEDYGILNENDLAVYARGKPLRPFNLENSGAYNYWQCFPREKVTVFLEDMGYSSDEL